MVRGSPRVSPADRNGMVDRVVRAALASLPHVSVLLFDPELRYLAVLGAAPHMHGYPAEALLGRPVLIGRMARFDLTPGMIPMDRLRLVIDSHMRPL